MCTISIIPLESGVSPIGSGFRIVCNRDESRRRPPAAHPRWRSIGDGPGRAVWPMDLQAGGTWIAASESGLALSLLNLNPIPPVNLRGHGKLRSRGLVIPHLLGAGSLAAVAGELSRMRLRHYAPFRLVGVEPPASGDLLVLEARWDRTRLDIAWHAGLPSCFVSSGLGDALVAPRLDLFEDMVVCPGAGPERQDEFHRHTWPDRPGLSVLMTRADARTVSITTLEVMGAGTMARVEMAYEPVADAVAAPAVLTRAR
jgi:hypothetical protein